MDTLADIIQTALMLRINKRKVGCVCERGWYGVERAPHEFLQCECAYGDVGGLGVNTCHCIFPEISLS